MATIVQMRMYVCVYSMINILSFQNQKFITNRSLELLRNIHRFRLDTIDQTTRAIMLKFYFVCLSCLDKQQQQQQQHQ